MNGKILMGIGIAVVAWGAAAIAYEQFIVAAVLIVAGVALFIVGQRHSKTK